MSEDSEDFTKLLKKYEVMFKMARKHMHECPSFAEQVLEEVEFNE